MNRRAPQEAADYLPARDALAILEVKQRLAGFVLRPRAKYVP